MKQNTSSKNNIILATVVLILISGWLMLVRGRRSDSVRFAYAEINRYGTDGRKMPANTQLNSTYQAETATSFWINREHVRLLGIVESQDEETRLKAVDFVKNWLEKSQYFVWFNNWSNAKQDATGKWIVWVEGLHGQQSRCLNVDLVEAGLAEVDYSEYLHYDFRLPEYGELGPLVKWRELLDKAAVTSTRIHRQ